MSGFVGRTRELGLLNAQLDAVRRGGRDARGAAVLLRGRRRVGKSRLVEELAARSEVPYVVFQAAKGAGPEREYAELARAVAASTLRRMPPMQRPTRKRRLVLSHWHAMAAAPRKHHAHRKFRVRLPFGTHI